MRAIRTIQRGFTLVSAIFLLVVIAALGAFAVNLSITQHQASALDVQGARAYQAARAGVEWGIYQLMRDTAFAVACQTAANSQTLNALPDTLAGFSVAVGCSSSMHDEGGRNAAAGNPIRVYTLVSTAAQGTPGTANYVERQVSVTIWR